MCGFLQKLSPWILAPFPPPHHTLHPQLTNSTSCIWASLRARPCSFLWSVISVSPAKEQEHCVLVKSAENLLFRLCGRRGPLVPSVSLKGLEICWCYADVRGAQSQHLTNLVNKWLWSSSVQNNGKNLNLSYCWHGSYLLFNKECKISIKPCQWNIALTPWYFQMISSHLCTSQYCVCKPGDSNTILSMMAHL